MSRRRHVQALELCVALVPFAAAMAAATAVSQTAAAQAAEAQTYETQTDDARSDDGQSGSAVAQSDERPSTPPAIGEGIDLPADAAPDAGLLGREPQTLDTTLDTLPILVVDMQQVRREASVVADVQRQIERRRDSYEVRLRDIERDLQQDQQSLLERRAEMSGEDYAEAVRALEDRLTRAQRQMRNTKANLDRLYNRGMLEIDRVIVSIAEEIAVERGAQLVLPKAAVLLVRNELEVTETVLQRLDRRLSSLDLDTLTPRP